MQEENHQYHCFIVDDNQIDRLSAASFIKKYSFLKITGIFSSAESAMEAISSRHPEVLFLDIDMPGITGLEMRKELDQIPACIFISSHPEFAVDGFAVNALDFLVKPIRANRFEASMHRLKDFLDLHEKAGILDNSLNEESIFIKDGHDRIRIQSYDVVYLEALKDYTGIITKNRKYCVLAPLSSLLLEKAFSGFIRIHRSYAIQKSFVHHLGSHSLMVNGIELPIGKTYRNTVQQLFA